MTLFLPSFTRFLVRSIGLLMLLLGVGLLAQAQSIRYVKPTASGNGSGSNWANASGDLQAMITASNSGQQVWVAAGTYKPGGNANTNRAVSFAMKNGVSMYGGFVGNETALSARPAINQSTPSATILSGDIGEAGDPEDNSFSVILNRLGVTNITVLDGFVITGGNANQSGPVQEPRNLGGGIYNVSQSSFANPSSGPPSSPQISNCLFVGNSAGSGGAIYNGGTSDVSGSILTNCVFRNNTASENGGAVYNRGGSPTDIQPTLTNCLFQSNSADAGGAVYNGGLRGRTSNPELMNCAFQDNSASNGGAVYNYGRSDRSNSSPALTNCSFKNNKAIIKNINATEELDQGGLGGAILNDGDFNGNSSPLIRNCSFQTNSAASGGAILNLTGRVGGDNRSRPKLTNCLFQTNTASNGGAIFNFTRYEGEIELVLTNCTFRANNAGTGGVLFGFGYGNGYLSNTTLINCVLFGNGGSNTFYNNSTTISATYSLFDTSVNGYSGSPGNRTVTVSPFASTSDPALFACSPAVNAGLNSATGLVGVTTDLAGNSRIFGERVDMGAYEYQAAGGLTITAPSVSTATAGVAFSQTFTASGGSAGAPDRSYSYSLASGSLPPGLSLAANGTLSGTPTGLGSFSITVKATNASSCSGVSATYVLRVSSATPIRYVKAGESGSGNSWADASGDLQSQINFPGAEQVWVATGTYKPTTTNRSVSFSMKNGVPIYGGFAGTETALSQRVLSDPLATILSGDIGTAGNTADNSYHVINNPPGLTNSAVLDGFLITGGNANGNSPDDSGGGMINNGNGAGNTCSPLIRNCLFLGNTANGGGAIHNAGYTNGNSNPTLINCAFQSNAANRGGAFYNDGSVGGNSNPSLTNCSFQANSAPSGGAMGNVGFQGNSRPVLTNCVVFGNGGASTFNNGPGAAITTSYSLFESSVTGYNAGTGDLSTTTSPFASTTRARLSCGSAAIDAGDPATSAATVGPIDLAGNARFFNGGRIDMGAYEAQGAATIVITTPGVSTATVGVAFSQSFTASGGTSPYSYSLASGSLPTGLNLATTGVLSGTSTQTGSFTLTVLSRDAIGCSGVSTAYVLQVASAMPIRYVRAGETGSGSSWADASGDLQSQINLTGAQQVWVAAGTYKPGGNANTNRSISFVMKNGVSILGGFVATGSPTLAERNPASFTTVLSGDIGVVGSKVDNSYHVISNSNRLTNTAVLDGFLVTGGNADPNAIFPNNVGGGMVNAGDGSGNVCSPTVINCSFQANSAFVGGAIYNDGRSNGTSNPVVINCSFQGNSASAGGAVYNDGGFDGTCNPVVTNCSFQGNMASEGGAIYNTGLASTTNLVLVNCVLFGNGGSNSIANNQGAGGRTSATYSLFETGVVYTDGGNNLTTSTNPFISTASTQLNGCSPAINTGNNAAYTTANGGMPPSPSTDLAGNARLFPSGGRIDMGAYEYQAPPTVITLTTPSGNTATVGVAFSQNITASGGSGPYSYSLASGSLPSGISLDNAGVLSGTPTQAGRFTITVRGQDATGCSGVSAAYVLTVIDATPTLAGFSANSEAVCVGNVATFTATVGNVTGSYNYTLTNGLSTSLTGNASGSPFSQSITASGTGTQSFTLTVSANGQSASSVTALTVNPSPVASLTSNGPLTCAQTSVTLTAGGGASYTFASGSGVLGTPGLVNTVVVSRSGTYSVTVANASGCVSSTTTTVQSNTASPTNISLTSGTLTCSNTSVTLTASSTGGTSYTLSDGQTSATGQFAVSKSGMYTVTTSGPNGCTASATSTVVSSTATPAASLSASSPTACAPASGPPTTITLTAGGGSSYTFSAGATQLGLTNQALVTQSGTYSVTVSNAGGCTATASTSVTVNTPPAAPTLTGVSRTVNASNTPLPLAQFVSAPGTLSFSGVSGALANPPTGTPAAASISTGGVQAFLVTQTDGNGCTSEATPFSLTVLPPTPGNQTVCRSSLVVLTALTTGVRYEWYKNGQSTPFKLTEIASIQKGTATSSLTLVSVQTTASYYCKVFLANGSFAFEGPLKVTVDYSCIAAGARLAAAEVTEVPLSVVLTPNPVVDGQLKAVVRGATGQALSVQLLGLNGQVVRSQQWPAAEGEQVIEWNIATQPAGLYLLQAQAVGQRSTAKVIHR